MITIEMYRRMAKRQFGATSQPTGGGPALTRAQVAKIYELNDAGYSSRDIAAQIGCRHSAVLYRLNKLKGLAR